MPTYDEIAELGVVPRFGTLSYYQWVINDYPDILKVEKHPDPFINLRIFVKPDYDDGMVEDFIVNHGFYGMTYELIVL